MPSSRSAASHVVPSFLLGAAGATLLCAGSTLAQMAEAPARLVPQTLDSGVLATPGLANASRSAPTSVLVFEGDVFAVESEWVRAEFGDVRLSGDPAMGTGAYLTIESLLDGQAQRLNAQTLAQWGNTSAYFRGPGVRVRLWASPGAAGDNRVSVRALQASVPNVPQNRWAGQDGRVMDDRSICDSTDDRQPSTDNRSARINRNCTAWVINDTNSNFLSAGHCRPSGTGAQVVEFNVPPSSSTGTVTPSAIDDQYAVDVTSQQHTNGGVGNDWWYFGAFPHPNHGQTPFQRYGVRHTLATTAPAAGTQPIRVTGYGTVASPVPRERNQTQQTHAGPFQGISGSSLRYRPDTTGGNSGSPVIDDSTGFAIGIHTHAGCTSTGGANQGSHILGISAAQNALNNPLGVCASGRGTPGGTLFAIGDRQNNFGTVQTSPNNFARIAQLGSFWQGMTYHPSATMFYAIDGARNMYSVTLTGTATLLAPVTGSEPSVASGIITGLAYDPMADAIFGIIAASGQLVRIDRTTWEASAVGGPGAPNLRALEFDALRRTLFGVEQTTATTASLVRIDTTTGVRTPVGALGLSNVVIGDIAVRGSDASILAINAQNGDLLRIDPATGAASVLGPTRGVFGSTYGLADSSAPPNSPSIVLDGFGVTDSGPNANANGLIEPGENGSPVSFGLRNVGLSGATGVSATLVSLTPGVMVNGPQVSLGDIASGAAQASPGGPTISVARDVPCGSLISLRVDVTASGSGEQWSIPVTLTLGLPGATNPTVTIPWTGATAIPDNNANGATVLLVVSGQNGTISDVDLRFDGSTCSTTTTSTTVGITHPNVGDLTVSLTSPDGRSATLINRVGGTGNNICQLRLDDGAPTDVQSLVASNNPFSGSFRPAQPLSAFNGVAANGIWVLRVTDGASLNTGTIRAVSLLITTQRDAVCVPPRCPADYNTDDALSVQDVFDYLAGYFAQDPRADFNGVNGITTQDLLDFVGAWFTGC